MTTEITLPEHEARSQMIEERLDDMSNIDDKVNIHVGGGQDSTAAILAAMGNRGAGVEALAPALMAAGGGGLGGANGIWPIVLLALLGRNGGGLFGGDGAAGGANLLQSSIDTNAIMQGISQLNAAVPLGSCQTMQAVTAAAADITSQTLQQTIGLTNQIDGAKAAGVAAANQNALLLTNGFANVGDKIDTLSSAQAVGFGVINTNIERTGWQLSQVTRDDGEKTRALITAQYEATLNRQLTEANNEIVELRNERARQDDRRGIEIQISNVQQQAQLQAQQQQQLIASLFPVVNEALQVARATNSNVIVGNTGATTTGAQTANPTNVRA